MKQWISVTFLFLFVALLPVSLWAEAPSLEEVMHRIETLDNAVDDATGILHFRMIPLGEKEEKSIHKLYWKNMKGQEGLISKILLITTSPINLKGEGFLIWEALEMKKSQGWLYLPELRQVRRVGLFTFEEHHHATPDDAEISPTFEEITQKLTRPGPLKVIKKGMKAGVPLWVIEKKFEESRDLSKGLFSVEPESGKIRKIEYFDNDGTRMKRIRIDWQKVEGTWFWKRIRVNTAHSSKKVVMEITELKTNVNIPDRLFSDGTLRSGRLR